MSRPKRTSCSLLHRSKAPTATDFHLHPTRECGACQVCCFALRISEIEKPLWTDCPHAKDRRCVLHDQPTYPAECRTYYCSWRQLQGGLLERERPDLLGLLLDGRQTTRGPLLTAWELSPGAAELPAAEAVLGRLSAAHVLALMPYALQPETDREQTLRSMAAQMGLPTKERKVLLGPRPLIDAFLQRPVCRVDGQTL